MRANLKVTDDITSTNALPAILNRKKDLGTQDYTLNHLRSLAINDLLEHLSDELAVGAAETEDLGSGYDVHGLQDQLMEPRLVHLHFICQEALLVVALARPPKLFDSYTKKQGSERLLPF